MDKNSKQEKIVGFSFLPINCIVIVLYDFLMKHSPDILIRNAVMAAVGGLVIGMIWLSRNKMADCDNAEHPYRFLIAYGSSVLLAIAGTFLPEMGWPFLIIYPALILLSERMTGFFAGSVILALASLATECSITVFLMYFATGAVCAVLFHDLHQKYATAAAVSLSGAFLAVCETACVILQRNETVKPESFLTTAVNIALSVIFLLIFLKAYYSKILFRYTDTYMEVYDPEYPVIKDFKEKNPEEYRKILHVAHFCDNISVKLGMDSEACKTAAYYTYITDMDLKKLPPKAENLVLECRKSRHNLVSPEAALIDFSDSIVSAIMYFYKQNSDRKCDFETIIDAIFEKKLKDGELKNCTLTVKDFERMKTMFKEDKLYYDFLH